MSRSLILAAAVALAFGAPELSAQTRAPTPLTKCQPQPGKPCPAAPVPLRDPNAITYADPFKDPARDKPDGDEWHTPRIQLDPTTSLGIGGIERKF